MLRLILLPLSVIYYFIILFRNLLFDLGIYKVHYFNTPIISVGNLKTGGTGKTPLVIYLTDFFISNNKSVGVISRGYKSKSNSLVIVSDGVSILADANSAGDELYMIANRFSGNKKFYAIAYYNRVEALNVMIENFLPDIIILDDAFQNRKINKTIDIIINDKENVPFLDSILLPAGNLREPRSSQKRADIIFNNFKFAEHIPSDDNIIKYEFSGLYDVNGVKVNINSDANAILVSGIANNNSFSNIISRYNINIIGKYNFPDHYSYSSNDINKFKNNYSENIVFITTEKDFVKMKLFKDFVTNYPVYYFKIDVILCNCELDNLLIRKNII